MFLGYKAIFKDGNPEKEVSEIMA